MQGIRRYGFHGISVQYSTRRAAELLQVPPNSSRLIVCHLGNGASVTAVANGKSVDTSMGFTPLEGIMMGTRSGSIDPSILVYLMRHHGYSADQIDEILNQQVRTAGRFRPLRRYARNSGSDREGQRAGAAGVRHLCASPDAGDRRDAGGAGRRGRDRLHRRHWRKLRAAAPGRSASSLRFWV